MEFLTSFSDLWGNFVGFQGMLCCQLCQLCQPRHVPGNEGKKVFVVGQNLAKKYWIAVHYISVHYITLHTSHHITLHEITGQLHYITFTLLRLAIVALNG